MNDSVIEKSAAQIETWLEKVRIELLGLGFSVVRTEWFHSVLDKLDKERVVNEVNTNF